MIRLEIVNSRFLQSTLEWVGENLTLTILLILFLMIYIYFEAKGVAKPDSMTSEKIKAMRPPVDKHLLFKKPSNSLIFGKWKNKYVCKPLTSDGHLLLIGGSGSGKSSEIVIPTLLSCPNTAVLSIDIKGELSKKTALLGSDKTIIFNPTTPDDYGYDPFWKINTLPYSEQLLFETMQTITFSLIPIPPNLDNLYWKGNARNLLLGLLIYQYKSGKENLIDIVDAILSEPIKELLTEIADDLTPNSIESRLLSPFMDLAETTLGGIQTEATQALSIFATDTYIRYAFKDNYKKMNPHMLEEGKNIYISIPENKLNAYSTITQLIINQTLQELEARSETAPPILLLFDELPRLLSSGKIEHLLDAARTLRSRNTTLGFITQSTSALAIAYSQAEVKDLISNCPYIVVLSASSSETVQEIQGWCGKYLAPKLSISGTGSASTTSVSYTEQNIIDASELMTLPKTGEAILISPYGYYRIKKTPYYRDKYFKKLHEKIIKANHDYLRTQEKQPKEVLSQASKLSEHPKEQETKDALLEWDDSLINFPAIDTDNLTFNESED